MAIIAAVHEGETAVKIVW